MRRLLHLQLVGAFALAFGGAPAARALRLQVGVETEADYMALHTARQAWAKDYEARWAGANFVDLYNARKLNDRSAERKEEVEAFAAASEDSPRTHLGVGTSNGERN